MSKRNESDEIRQSMERLAGQAEVLFYFRELALGVFHQVANHLHNIASGLLYIDVMSGNERTNREAELGNEVKRVKEEVRVAMELIHAAQKRGQTLEPIRRACMLNESVVRPAIQYIMSRATDTGIVIRHTLTNKDYAVVLDVSLAKESLINILNNAVWAVKENKKSTKKEILVAVRELPEERAVRVEITDSGIGIAEEDYAHLFKPFFTTRPMGTGLGLYFARRLIEQFGGTLAITRSSRGRGTTVEIRLPVEQTSS